MLRVYYGIAGCGKTKVLYDKCNSDTDSILLEAKNYNVDIPINDRTHISQSRDLGSVEFMYFNYNSIGSFIEILNERPNVKNIYIDSGEMLTIYFKPLFEVLISQGYSIHISAHKYIGGDLSPLFQWVCYFKDVLFENLSSMDRCESCGNIAETSIWKKVDILEKTWDKSIWDRYKLRLCSSCAKDLLNTGGYIL